MWFAVGVVVSPANAASDHLKYLELVIVKVVPSGEITIRMANASHQEPLRVWTEANSWGALRWKVVILRGSQTLVLFEDPDGVVFGKNTPQFDTIAPDAHIDRQLNINGEYWAKQGTARVQFQSGDRVIVIYDVLPEKEAKEMHVWYGVAAASVRVK